MPAVPPPPPRKKRRRSWPTPTQTVRQPSLAGSMDPDHSSLPFDWIFVVFFHPPTLPPNTAPVVTALQAHVAAFEARFQAQYATLEAGVEAVTSFERRLHAAAARLSQIHAQVCDAFFIYYFSIFGTFVEIPFNKHDPLSSNPLSHRTVRGGREGVGGAGGGARDGSRKRRVAVTLRSPR